MDWRRLKRKVSFQLEDEPLSLTLIKGGRKVLCGTQEGTLAIYNVRSQMMAGGESQIGDEGRPEYCCFQGSPTGVDGVVEEPRKIVHLVLLFV